MKKKHFGKRKMTVPAAVALPVGYKAYDLWNHRTDSGYVIWNTVGVDNTGKFHMEKAISNWIPTLAGVVIHYGANRFGVNRILANAKIPLIRV